MSIKSSDRAGEDDGGARNASCEVGVVGEVQARGTTARQAMSER